MKIIKLFFNVLGNEESINILSDKFVRENENRCKIIYNNRTYPLKTIFRITGQERESNILRIKLKFTDDIKIFNLSQEITGPLNHMEEINKFYQNIRRKHGTFLKISEYDIFKSEYKIPHFKSKINSLNEVNKENKDKSSDKIRIFGKNFVQNNKDKCFIIYKKKIYPLKEYFLKEDIDIEDTNLEILLIDVKNIFNKSFMFKDCNLLINFEGDLAYYQDDNLPNFSSEQNEEQIESNILNNEEGNINEYIDNMREINPSNQYDEENLIMRFLQNDLKKYNEFYESINIEEINPDDKENDPSIIMGILNLFNKISLFYEKYSNF